MRRSLLCIALLATVATPTAFAHNHGGDAKPMDAAAHDAHEQAKAALDAAIAGEWRAPANVARDAFRNPGPTLGFFGITPTMTVIEVTPGAGWYAEILAPYLRDGGRYVAVVNDPAKASSPRAAEYHANNNKALRDKFAANATVYGSPTVVEFNPAEPTFGAAGSADAVLTFRNVHNWMMGDQEAGMFKGFFEVLKPGGVLGVVEHRAKADVADGDRSGYVSEAQVIAMATAAGFVLEEKSEINANPKDDADHPNGVWTLPPSLNVPEGEDKAVYQAIGESDRMTLRFRKPAA